MPYLCLFFSLFWIALATAAENNTENLFQQHAAAVVKVQVINIDSGAKSVIGSGFFVDKQGHLITNYHVVSKWVNEPDKYRVEYLDEKRQAQVLKVLNVDVVNDLAVAVTTQVIANKLQLSDKPVVQGANLYAFGFPHDYEATIVDGTYNGLINHAFYPKIHFTGSLNSGMSGGPTLNATGQVIGVNVATSGNQISFLVPAKYAIELYQQTTSPSYQPPTSFIKLVTRQLTTHQKNYLANQLFLDQKQATLGQYLVPTLPAAFFQCWGDSSEHKNKAAKFTRHQCSSEDNMFISEQQVTAPAQLKHTHIEAVSLNSYQFTTLQSKIFSHQSGMDTDEESQFSGFRCHSSAIKHNGLSLKAALCLRKYHKLEGLYDAVFKITSIGDTQHAIDSELSLFAVTYETATSISRRYLELFAWKK